MSTFPGSVPSYSTMDPNQTLSAAGHTSRHNEVQLDVAALATKVGTGASTPSGGTVLKGTGTGTSAYGAVDLATDVTGKLPVANVDLLTILGTVYPVGSIYTSVVSTNPNILFGVGTWIAFGQGAVPVGVNAADTDFNAAEKTGGEKTHALTTDEMPSHTHVQRADGSANNFAAGVNATSPYNYSGSTLSSNLSTDPTGGGGAHNNLQPYITVYMWKRTA